MAAVVRAGRFSIWLLVVNFNFSFLIGLQFRADDFQIPQQRQALPVGCNFFEHLDTFNKLKNMKQIILFFSILISLHSSGQDIAKGLVAYYPLNGNAKDLSGNGYDGEVYGATPTTDYLGKNNNAMLFNGSNNYISIPSKAINNLKEGTISFWINLYDNKSGTILAKQHDGVNSISVLGVGYIPSQQTSNIEGRLSYHLSNSSSTNGILYEIESYKFCNVVLSFNSEKINFYVNGILKSSYNGNYNIPNDNNPTSTTIGAWLNGGGGKFLNGKLDELRIYNRMLANEEVILLFGKETSNEIVNKTPVVQDETKSKNELTTNQDAEEWYFENNPSKKYYFSRINDSTFKIKDQNGNSISVKKPYNYEGLTGGETSRYSFWGVVGDYDDGNQYGYNLFYKKVDKITLYIDYWNPNTRREKRLGIFALRKNLNNINEKNIKDLGLKNILYRSEFKFGKIGEDYVPAITSFYNAGKTYIVNGVEIQEKDYQSKVEKGGNSQDIQGYTAVFQIINKSTKNYLIDFSINGTSKMTDIIRNKKWFSFNDYETKEIFTDFDYNNTILLKPDENFKGQVIAGVEIPSNYAILTNNIIEVSTNWIESLQQAVNGNNLQLSRKILNDPIVQKYYRKNVQLNIDRLEKVENKLFTESSKKLFTITISPKDNALFDEDFESEIVIKISNNSLFKSQLTATSPFGLISEIIEPQKTIYVSKTIKGVKKENLKATIEIISKVD